MSLHTNLRSAFSCATIALALAAFGACSDRAREPFEPGPPQEPTWALNSVTVATSVNARLASNSAVSGFRDDLGTMHLLWEDGTAIRHGIVTLAQTQWTVLNSLPNFSAVASVRRPVLASTASGVFIAAWLEQLGGNNRIVVSRSLNRGGDWESPISLVSTTNAITSPVIYGFRRGSLTPGAVVAWSDPGTGLATRIFATTWRGAQWNAGDWTTAAQVSTNATGTARDVSLAGTGEEVIAVWADTRGALGGATGIFASRSSNGGQSWDADALIGIPISSSGVGSEPSVAVGPAADVVIGWTAQGGIFAARSQDRGNTFTVPRRLGDGFGSRVAIGDGGRIAIAWTAGAGAGSDEMQHSVALSISLDNLLTVNGPGAMPGSSTTARTQARSFLSGASLDMIWTDVAGGTRSIQHRTARLP